MNPREENEIRRAMTVKRPALTTNDRALLRRFVRGEITFAQLEGITAEEALSLSETGHAYFTSGRLAQARTIFEGLAAINHLDPYPRQVLGAICEREGSDAQARAHYDVCLSLNHDNPWVLARRGEMRVRSGELKEGVDDLVQACELDKEARLLTTARAQLLLANLVDAAREVKSAAPRADT